MIRTLRLDSKTEPRRAIPKRAALIVGGERASLRFDYHVQTHSLGAYVRTDNNDTTASVSLNVPGIGGSVRLESKALRHLRDFALGASLDWSEGGLYLHWQPDVRGRNCTDLLELAFGKLCQEQSTRVTVATKFGLPEGEYPCVVSLLDVATWRSQVPRASRKEFVAAEVRFAVAPKYPGKGESDYDQGDDFVSASYLPGVGTVGDALATVYGNVIRVREHRASLAWQPKDGGFVPPQPNAHVHGAQYFPAVENVSRLLGVRAMGAFRMNGTGLLVIHVDKKLDESLLERAHTRIDELCTGIDDTTVQHVAFVTRGNGRIYGFDEHANLVPFDLDKWSGSPSVFFPLA